MSGEFIHESFDSLSSEWANLEAKSKANHIFSSLAWSKVWWQHFGLDKTINLGSVRSQGKVIGIAPLVTKGNEASFIGSVDVCDYLDFIVEPGKENFFFEILLENLIRAGIKHLDLAPLRPDSTVLLHLTKIVQSHKFEGTLNKEDVSLDLSLPMTWESYLQLLNSKQRHEIKRKMRRLAEMGTINFRANLDANQEDINLFLKLFQQSRTDKAAFLTPKMEAFFRSLFATMTQMKLLRLNFLELNGKPIAATICLDYKDSVYLYNSGYDPDLSWLSAGLISKAMCIQDSIQRNRKRFDFLKGNEEYKYHLGGQEFPVYRYSVTLIK